ncbi:acyl-CoA dehydrogenase family protein [Streptomyces sp. G-G2]|uniref:acyl-CoA dehydrogenase family protein n=1 Tax=Streptomyces sp. G-G2 TaxID=3046201 RepID=UPI0024BA628D|nr:acyl-CoA dehydrogenase family protein [Streptomyces sp. G-G2]MDJ0384348.1 acyl-CoA dehydrogenase family protein [Streptomyces sp. G-G2]
MRALEWTREQRELGAAVRSVLARHRGTRAWAPLAGQVGVAALAVPEEYGGLGCGAVELGVVAAELGRVLSPVPFLGSAVLTVGALLAAGDPKACARLLPGLAEGSAVGALAWAEGGSWEPSALAARARRDPAGGWLLNGAKEYVLAGLGGELPSVVLVFARAAGSGRRGAGGVLPLSLFRLTAPPAAWRVRSTMDLTRPLAELALDRTPAELVGVEGDGERILARVRDLGVTALAAEQAGAAARALQVTVAHAKQRFQFGRPIGSFQAVKHRLADLYAAVENGRTLALAAADAHATDGGGAPGLAAAAGSACGEAYSLVAGEMIQLHGGTGITWEHESHLHFKRAHGAARLFGGPAAHRERLAARLGLAGAR